MPLLRRICLTASFAMMAVSASAEITVFAAASLRNALDVVNVSYPQPVTVSYAGSAALARQIEQGAPADVFISANTVWMDYLEGRDILQENSRVTLLGNQLVLIGSTPDEVFQVSDLTVKIQGSHIAMGYTSAVPAGIYGKEALSSLGLWTGLQTHVVQTDHVQAALRLVALKEVGFGVVYATDALADDRVSTLYEFPENSHTPIQYPAALISDDPAAAAYLAYLQSSQAKSIFTSYGFQIEGPE